MHDMRRARQDLIADVWLYPTDQGGKSQSVFSGWDCPCKTTLDPEEPAWDGWPILGEVELCPGETGRFGWMFLSGDQAASQMRQAGKFYLWEGRIIGEAVVVTE
ncbi:hypothetical protein [Sphingobium lignivorans]|uniref:Uncharacterized protein n=1 Tax=Sphingobium lignivorans TaxID=2735886 RepID=A0ABR6NI20_9SPHN|nr:hypothetical protein [Sphingobium lignivorans]MBB5986935.1 hypothetical protein [Sphingobium lignivorans]